MKGEEGLKKIVGQSYAAGWRDGYKAALRIRGIRPAASRDAIRADVARFVEAQQQKRRGVDGGDF